MIIEYSRIRETAIPPQRSIPSDRDWETKPASQ